MLPPSILMVAAGSIHQKYFQNQQLTRYNVPWAFSFLHPYSIHWVFLNIISLISNLLFYHLFMFSKWPPILGWMGPVCPLCCNPRLNTVSHIQKPVSNFHLCQIFTIKVYMPTVQFAEVPNKSSISNNCCIFAIMFR